MEGPHIKVREITPDEAPALLELQLENRDWFERFSPARAPGFYTLEHQLQLIRKQEEARRQDQAYEFGIFTNTGGRLIGTISLFQIRRGPLQSALIGYDLSRACNGKGYTTEAVRLLVDCGFRRLGLHRIEAGVMPHNIASIRVLEKSGFQKEGLARQNVRINGRWEDHQVLAILNPDDGEEGAEPEPGQATDKMEKRQ
ncbi:GNAT family N-acetyltransferase [Paenibacillus spiritus]|uniref:GNAT family N-acetyltransferase n=1 Tax=Paenibacillus spiritus TaxID=2496557 RepID=A0A5J5GBR9_9BACL|nr:GNAT family protein [Paenibacillus spiritus]KAA9005468.1 GNAT family N-acetyltransferase [Paenibacillus spiritus]